MHGNTKKILVLIFLMFFSFPFYAQAQYVDVKAEFGIPEELMDSDTIEECQVFFQKEMYEASLDACKRVENKARKSWLKMDEDLRMKSLIYSLRIQGKIYQMQGKYDKAKQSFALAYALNVSYSSDEKEKNEELSSAIDWDLWHQANQLFIDSFLKQSPQSRPLILLVKNEKDYETIFNVEVKKEEGIFFTKVKKIKVTIPNLFFAGKLAFQTNTEFHLNWDYRERLHSLLWPLSMVGDVLSYIYANEDFHVSFFAVDNMPNIVVDNPETGKLYMVHPHIPNKYIAAETYEEELLNEQLTEYIDLQRMLGAKEISWSVETDKQTSLSQTQTHTIGGNIDKETMAAITEDSFPVGVSAAFLKSHSNSLLQTLLSSKSKREKYKPTKKPALPNNLIWYPHESEWKRHCKHRMDNEMIEFEETLTDSHAIQFKQSQKSEIEVGLTGILTFSLSKDLQEQFQSTREINITISAIFEDLNSLPPATKGKMDVDAWCLLK